MSSACSAISGWKAGRRAEALFCHINHLDKKERKRRPKAKKWPPEVNPRRAAWMVFGDLIFSVFLTVRQ
jgi:hypothetical protein